MPLPEECPLTAYLARSFIKATLIAESPGKSAWRAECKESAWLVRGFADWSLKDEEQNGLMERYRLLAGNPWSSLPKLREPARCKGHLLFIEEWIGGSTWDETILSRESALDSGKELFDLLAELAERGIVHGRISARRIIVEESSGRLKLLGLFSGPLPTQSSAAGDRVDALSCLRGLLRDEEYSMLLATASPREASAKLAGLLCEVEPAGNEPDLVGREWALRALSRFYSEGGLAAVLAPGGGGKSHLLRSWSSLLEDRVLVGKAERGIAPSPFQMFQRPFRQIESELEENPGLLRELQRELPVTLPLLDSLRGGKMLERGAVRWLAKLLSTLHRFRPTVLILEDVHWADPFTLSFLEYWSKESQGAFVVYSMREETLGSDHILHRLTSNVLRLPPLSRSQAERVLRSMRPNSSQTFIESAMQKAEGNPFLLLQYLRSGHIQGDLEELGLSSLRDSCQNSLATAALLGNRCELSLLRECLGTEPDLAPAEKLGIVKVDDDTVVFLHDRFREVSLGILDSEKLCEAHLSAAIAHLGRNDPYRVSYHYRQAGRPDLGVEHSLLAAEKSRAKDDLNTSIYYLHAAAEGLPDQHPDLPQVSFRLGDCYRLIGRYDDSVRCFLKVLSATDDPVFKARVLHVLGDVYFKQDELQKAREAVTEGLKLLGSRPPVSIPLSFLYQAFGLTLRHYFPRAGSAPKREQALLKASLYNCLAYVNWFLEGPIPSIRAHFCELNIAERYGDSAELARAQANHAIAMSALPWWSRARLYGEKSVETARRIGDKWSEGRVGHFYGAVLLGAAHLSEAERVLLRAVELLQQTGDRWEENGVRYHLAVVYYRMGELQKAREIAIQTHKTGVDIGDRLAAGDNLYTWARASNGELPRAVLEKEKTYSSPDLQRTCELLAAEALIDLRECNYDKAVELLESACAKYSEKMVRNLYAASLPCWLTTARRLYLQTLPESQRREPLVQALKTAKVALREAHKFITNLPHAQRELGLLAILQGDRTRARSHLKKSLEAAEKQGQRAEAAVTRAAMEHFSWLLGIPHETTENKTGVAPKIEYEYLWLLGPRLRNEAREQFTLNRLLQAATSISGCLSEETTLHTLCLGILDSLSQVAECAVAESRSGLWEFVAGSPNLPLETEYYEGEGRQAVSIPDYQKRLILLLRLEVPQLGRKSRDVLDFLIAVTAAAIDRAHNTASSRVLSQDLRLSSLRLHEEEQRLSRAKEQLLLGERLAITGRLATGLVHDLKNLTMSVTSTAEYLKLETCSQPDLNEAVTDILEAGKKAAELLGHLSGLNRGEMLGARALDLKQRIQETKPLLLSLCGPAVALNFQLKSSLWASVDPIQLDRILLNLVVNARDAVRFGGRVNVSLASVLVTEEIQGYPTIVPCGEYCRISVKDDGCGIPEEVLPQIFDLHFTTKGMAGTGVGLATVREMVESNKGHLTVTTGSDGTLFELYFPLISEPSAVPALRS